MGPIKRALDFLQVLPSHDGSESRLCCQLEGSVAQADKCRLGPPQVPPKQA